MTWLPTRPYQILFQLFKTLGHGAPMAYFLTFGGQTRTTVRRWLRKLEQLGAVKRDSRGVYCITATGNRIIWNGGRLSGY